MNICLVSMEYPPERHIGGIATYTHNVAKGLGRLGHNVHVLTVGSGKPRGERVERVERDGDVTLHRLKGIDYRFSSLGYLLHSYAVAQRLNNIGCALDIVQSSEWSGEAFWYSLRPKTPLVSRLATPTFLVQRLNSSSGGAVSRIVDHMERVQVKNSAGIMSSTNALAKRVCDEWDIPLSRVRVIPNSLDLDRIRSFKAVSPRIDLGGHDYVLYYGRLEERKGVHVLAEALPDVLRRYTGLKVVFAGADGLYGGRSMRQYVQQQCATFVDRLVFLDSLPQAELFPIVARAKLVVLPSLWEAFGFVCLEAMCLGRPVVASGGSGFEEIIDDDISGYLVQPGNHAALRAKIIWCLEHDDDTRRVGVAAEQRAQEFSVNNIALSLVQYYESLLQPSKVLAAR